MKISWHKGLFKGFIFQLLFDKLFILVVLIGYFSLPDWSSRANVSPGINKDAYNISFTYKFEILDSVLLTPVVNADYQFIKLNIAQLYFTSIENNDSDILLKEIPLECSVPPDYITDHLLWKDNASEVKSVSLVASFKLSYEVYKFTSFVLTSNQNMQVLGLTAVTFASKRDVGCFAPDINVPTQFMRNLIDIDSSSELLEGTQIQDLYDLLEIKIIDFQINLFVPFYPYTFPILEKLNASSALALCIVQNESLLKALEFYAVVGTLLAHVSPSILGSLLKLVESIDMLHHASHLGATSATSSFDMDLNKPKNSNISVIANLESASIIVDLENGLEASCTLTVSFQDVDMRLVTMKSTKSFWICTRDLKVTCRLLKSGDDLELINVSLNGLSHEVERNDSPNGCLMLHYDGDLSIWLSDLDLHCYPHIIGLLVEFFDKLSEYSPSHADKNQDFVGSNSNSILSGSYFDFKRFGCSNLYDTCSSDWESISVNHYPFVTIYNDKSLLSLESSLINISPDWKKVLKTREDEINSSKFRAKKEFQKLSDPDHDQVGLVVINLDLNSIRLHLHDSSSIVASVTLPAAKSSFAVHETCLDVLCSTEGLSLSSHWYPQTLQDSLWGPASLNLSPVINIRVRKGDLGIELDFSIQNVSCVLPTEFMAVLIGNFSLPDWNSHANESPGINKNTESITFTYTFEILDSVLLTPVVNADYQFIKLNIPQLYFTFIENSDSDILLKEIPLECSVPPDFITDQTHCLNVFGRDLSLHHLIWKDNASEVTSVSFIAPFSFIAPLSLHHLKSYF